ncbi:MAG: hypothetical protein WCK91_00735 [bacterium]
MTTIQADNFIGVFDQMFVNIIKEQELIIGPVAWDEAKKVPGFHVIDQAKGEVSFDGDGKEVLARLIDQYALLFGKASNEVCKEAVQSLLSKLTPEQIPASLK